MKTSIYMSLVSTAALAIWAWGAEQAHAQAGGPNVTPPIVNEGTRTTTDAAKKGIEAERKKAEDQRKRAEDEAKKKGATGK